MTDLTSAPTTGASSSGGRGQELVDAARGKAGELKQGAHEMAGQAMSNVKDKVEGKKETATATLSDFAEAIRRAGEELQNRDQSLGAKLAQQAAEGLAGLSQSLNDKSPEDMLRSARELGRSNPMAFFAASVLAGVALGRVAGASAHHLQERTEPSDATFTGAPSATSFVETTPVPASLVEPESAAFAPPSATRSEPVQPATGASTLTGLTGDASLER